MITNFQSQNLQREIIRKILNDFFFKFSPTDLVIILYQMTMFEAPSCNTFRDIMITKQVTNFQSPNLQREIIHQKKTNFF